MRSVVRSLLAVALTAATVVTAAGCGSSGGDTSAPPAPEPSGVPADFPTAHGGTLPDLTSKLPEGPILAPSVSLLDKGTDRVGFALFDRARKQIAGAKVAIYTARPDGSGVRGPFVARSESLAVKSSFESKTTSEDPDAARSVYVAEVPFTRRGTVVVTALARLDGRLMATSPQGLKVGTSGAEPPGPGDRAIPIDTPTRASVGGDEAKIDTRDPGAPSLHAVNFRDVLGRKPVVLTFATPRLCQSRVCGPVVDVVLQAQAKYGKRVAFIHQEVYRDNDIQKGINPQLGAWHLASEPWTFVIDRTGRVSTRFEGAISAGELERAVAKVS